MPTSHPSLRQPHPLSHFLHQSQSGQDIIAPGELANPCFTAQSAVSKQGRTTRQAISKPSLDSDAPACPKPRFAVEREGGAYVGRTILELDWVYNNARLIARPDSDWLTPNIIQEIDDRSESDPRSSSMAGIHADNLMG
ncbi:MAG: DUF3825 domain-containing protein [bacterium]